MSDKIFPAGIRFYGKNEKAPSWVIGTVEITSASELRDFLTQHGGHDGKCRFDVKVSQGGKTYMELNTFVPQGRQEMTAKEQFAMVTGGTLPERPKAAVIENSDLPF